MFRTILIGMMVMALTSIAAAQSGDYKRLEFFAGYSHNQIDTGTDDDFPRSGDMFGKRESFQGVETSVTGNVSRYVGLKFDFSAHFRQRTFAFPTFPRPLKIDWRLYNFLGGIQVKDNSSEATFKPFAHALAGVAHTRMDSRIEGVFRGTDRDTAPAGAVGGGVDIRVSRRFDIRAIQLDYNPTKFFDGTQHNFRTGVGIVLH